MRLLLATHNRGKVAELSALLRGKPFQILSLLDFPDYIAPPEDGSTFEENALIKARKAALVLGMPSLADDSGLVVEALGGAPGVYSARYSGEGATDLANREKLLREMEGLSFEKRRAYFECTCALVFPDGREKTTSGRVWGHILENPRGERGFGYDPLFVKEGSSESFAELDEATKNRISHRAIAMEEMALILDSVASNQ